MAWKTFSFSELHEKNTKFKLETSSVFDKMT